MVAQLEDPEDTQDSENSDYHHITKQRAQIGRKYRKQIDDAEEADGVSHRSPNAEQAQYVFDREENREEPLDSLEKSAVSCIDRVDTVEHDRQYTEQNAHYQHDIEPFARRRVSLENHLEQYLSPAAIRAIGFCCTHGSTFSA